MTATVMLVLFTVIAISVGINVYFLWRRRRATAREISTVLLQGIQEVNDLATVRQSFQSIVMYEDSRSLLGLPLPGTHKKFILKYSGNIIVGTDLSKIDITQFISGRVRITLPNSRILSVTADMNSIKVYDQHSGIFNPLSFNEQNHAISANLLEIEEEARSGDLLTRSNENAKSLISSICKNIGVGVEVEFVDEISLPESKPVSIVLPEAQRKISSNKKLVEVD